jgi:hypothetical protein
MKKPRIDDGDVKCWIGGNRLMPKSKYYKIK